MFFALSCRADLPDSGLTNSYIHQYFYRRKISVKLSIILVKISSPTTPEIWFYYGERNNKFPWSNLIWVIRWYTSTAEWIVQSMSDTLLRTDILSYYTGLEVFSRLDWKYLRPINEAIWTVSHRSNKWTNFNVNLSSTLFISRNWRKKNKWWFELKILQVWYVYKCNT